MRKRERPVVLVAADDPPVRRLVAGALRSDGFAPADSRGLSDPVDAIVVVHPDVVVLQADVAETRTGRDLQDQAEAESIPVLWLGRQPGPSGAVEALDHARADDYVAPPFDPVELGARVRALLRRRGMAIAAGRRRIGGAIVDLDRRELWRAGLRHPLGRADWAVLARLIEAQGIAVPYSELLSAAFGTPFRDEIGLVRAAVSRIRRALGARPGQPGPIRTVRGIGYRLAD